MLTPGIRIAHLQRDTSTAAPPMFGQSEGGQPLHLLLSLLKTSLLQYFLLFLASLFAQPMTLCSLRIPLY